MPKPSGWMYLGIAAATIGVIAVAYHLLLSPKISDVEPPWRFVPNTDYHKPVAEWTGTFHWISPAKTPADIKNRSIYLLTVTASDDKSPLATEILTWNVAVDVDGHPVEIEVTRESAPSRSKCAITSYINVENSAQQLEFALVNAEPARDFLMVSDESGTVNYTTYGSSRFCPTLDVSASSIYVDKDFESLKHLALPEVIDATADFVRNADSPPGMFPGSHQPVRWELCMQPIDPSLPTQIATIALGGKDAAVVRKTSTR